MPGQPITRQKERAARKQAGNAQPLPNQAPPEAAGDAITQEAIPQHGLISDHEHIPSAHLLPYTTGRPTDYNNVIADMICNRITNGDSLHKICQMPGSPDPATIFRWLGKYPDFSDLYARAREEQSETLVDQILYIADTCDDPRIAAVRIDARKWIASKLKPKKYGDIRQLDVSGGIDLNVAAVNKRLPGAHKQAGPDRQIDAPKGA